MIVFKSIGQIILKNDVSHGMELFQRTNDATGMCVTIFVQKPQQGLLADTHTKKFVSRVITT